MLSYPSTGYHWGSFAPGVYRPPDGAYLAGHSIIKAHAKAYHVYDDNYRSAQQGRVGITMNSNWEDPQEAMNPVHWEAMVI